jgi:DNA-binding MarR family transcriptional regulator
VQSLADVTNGKCGLDLIYRSMDFSRDGRSHILQLTEKGRELAQSLISTVNCA